MRYLCSMRGQIGWMRGLLIGMTAVFVGAPVFAEEDPPSTPPGIVVLDSLNELPGVSIENEGSEVHVRFQGEDESRSIRISIDESDDSGIVRFGEDVEVLSGEIVDGDVVSIGGSIRVAGRVEGEVVAIGGDLLIEDGAVIDGDVVCIGGRLAMGNVVIDGDAVSVWGSMEESSLADITGDVVEVGGFGPVAWGRGWDNWDNGFGWGWSRVATRAFWVLLLIGLAFLFFHIFPDRMNTMVDAHAKPRPLGFRHRMFVLDHVSPGPNCFDDYRDWNRGRPGVDHAHPADHIGGLYCRG